MTIGQMMRLGAGGAGYAIKVLKYSPIAYWPLWEAAGGVAECLVNPAQNGAYTGVTLGQPGIGDGNTCPLFDGATDFVDIFTAGLQGAFDGAEGTLMVWAKVFNVGVWTDAADRFLFRLEVDGNNYVFCAKTITNNRLFFRYTAGGVVEAQAVGGLTTIKWMCLGMTWSKLAGVNGEVKYFFDGVQQGATDTALGVWAGNLAAATTVIGTSDTAPLNLWHGWLAHAAVWDVALTPTEMAELAG